MKMKSLTLAVLASVVLCQPAWAARWHDDQGHGNKHWKHHGDDDRDEEFDERECFFQPRDIGIITGYYRPQERRLPPGLAKKYYRTGQLPPGWQKKLQPLPVAIERQLIVLPPQYRRGIIDGYVVVYDPLARVILDVVAAFGR